MGIMNLQSNPFYILHASPADDRTALQRKASEVILLEGSTEAEKALSGLLHPLKRLEAELNWFPETDQAEIDKIISFCENGGTLPDFSTESDLAVINGCRYMLKSWPCELAEGLAGLGLCLAGALVRLSFSRIIDELNSARSLSGFPLLSEDGIVSDHILELQEGVMGYFSSRVKDASDGQALSAAYALATAFSSNKEIYKNNYHLKKMVDYCMLPTADEEKRAYTEAVRNASGMFCSTYNLIPVINEWNHLSSPRRMISKAQGLADNDSEKLLQVLNDYINDRLHKKQFTEATDILHLVIDTFTDLPPEKISQHRTLLQDLSSLIIFFRKK
ncbi:MAG: hypothetical protein IJ123_07195 [Blautia sp.]|nr:hypothetical protein [Blautia sp.]